MKLIDKFISAAAALSILCSTVTAVSFADAGDPVPTPIASFDFTGRSKTDAEKDYITSGDYTLYVDASSDNKSSYESITAEKGAIQFDNRTYLQVITSASDTSANEKMLNVLDGDFTFETWIYIPNCDAVFKNAEREDVELLFSGANVDSSYSLKVSLINNNNENMKIQLNRVFSDGGQVRSRTEDTFDYGKWNHISVSYSPKAVGNVPSIVINGKASAMQDANTTTASGATATTHASGYKARIGGTDNFAIALFNTKYADIKFYDQAISEAQQQETYLASLPSFEAPYSVEIYDGEVLIPESGYSELSQEDISIKIDFTGADKSTVTEGNVEIIDKADNSRINYKGAWEGDSYVLSDITLQDTHEYTLKIKSIKNEADEFIRISDYDVDLACKAVNISPVAVWDFSELSKSSTAKQYLASKPAGYTLKVDASADQPSEYEVIGVNETQELHFTNNVYLNVNDPTSQDSASTEMLDILDGAFTFETWLNIGKLGDEASAYNGILAVNDNSGSPYRLIISAEKDSSTGKYRLRLLRKYQYMSGTTATEKDLHYLTPADLNFGELNHIMVSFDPSSSTNKPVISVNGVEKALTSINYDTINAASNTEIQAMSYTDLSTPVVRMGTYTGNNRITNSSFADIKFYDMVLTPAQQAKQYNKAYAKIFKPAEVVKIDPIAEWDFTGLSKSSTENQYLASTPAGYTLKVVANESYQSNYEPIGGGYKQALRFVSNTYLNVTDPAAQDSVSTAMLEKMDGELTFETWINIGSLQKKDDNSIFLVGNDTTWSVKLTAFKGSTEGTYGIDFNRCYKNTTVSGNPQLAYQTATDMTCGQWYHIMVSFDPSSVTNTPKIIVNGEVKMLTNSQNGAITKLNEGNTLEARSYTEYDNPAIKIGGYFNGQGLAGTSYADIKIYDKALSAAQMKAEYAEEKAEFDLVPYTIEYLNQDDTTADTATASEVKAKITAIDDFAQGTMFVIAVYENSVLKAADVAYQASATPKEIVTNMVNVADGSSVRVFLWDANLRPYIDNVIGFTK